MEEETKILTEEETSHEQPDEQAPKKFNWKYGAVVLLVILLGVVYFFYSNKGQDSTAETTKVSVRLSWVHQGQFAGFYVAKEKGFYEEMGLDVELLELDETKSQTNEIDSGEIEFSVMEAHQLLVGVDEGADIEAIMAVYQINPHVLAARADSGIVGPEDFEGKVIGLSGGDGEGNAIFRIFVERFGSTDSVSYKNLGFDSVQDFIDNNADVIDVYSIDQPFLAEKRGVPLVTIPLDAYGFSTYGDVLVVNKSFADQNPELVEKFVSATIQGWEHTLANQEEAISITLPYTSGDYSDEEYQRHIIQNSVPLVRGTQKDLGKMELVSWSTLFESMRSAGAIESDFNVADIYTNEFIK